MGKFSWRNTFWFLYFVIGAYGTYIAVEWSVVRSVEALTTLATRTTGDDNDR